MRTVLSLPIQETLARSTLLVHVNLPYASYRTIHRYNDTHPIKADVYSFSNHNNFYIDNPSKVNNYSNTPLDDFTLTSNLVHFYPTTKINHTRRIHYLEMTKRPDQTEINSGTKTIVEKRQTFLFKDPEEGINDKRFSIIDPNLDHIQTHISWLDFLPLSSDQENPIHLVFQNKINNKVNLSVFYGILSYLSGSNSHYFTKDMVNRTNELGVRDATLMSLKCALEFIITRKGHFNDECLSDYTTHDSLFTIIKQDDYKPDELEYLNKIYPVFKFILDNIFMQETKRYIFYTDNINNHLTPNKNDIIIPFSNIVPDTKEKTQINVADKVIVFKDITNINIDVFHFINYFDTYLTEEELIHDRTNPEKV